jgi:hypothetical protein
MAVTIVDRRTTVTTAENTTNWTGAGFGVQSTDVAEGTNAVAAALNIASGPVYFTSGTSVNLSNTLVYVYASNNAIQPEWNVTIPPLGLLIGDGTNRIAFRMSGSDKRSFSHSDGPTSWQSLVVDGSTITQLNTDGLVYVQNGSLGALNSSAITQFGAQFQTLSKAIGGGYNVTVDIIRYGNDGIYVIGGSVSDPGTCLNIATSDRSRSANTAHGLFREYAPTAFGVQGPLTFGESGNSYFSDRGVVIVYEDRYVADGKYYFDVAGTNAQNNQFRLRDSTITTAGPSLTVRIKNDVNYCEFNNVSFVSLGSTISFPYDTNPGAGRTHITNNCTFTECSTVDPGSIVFQNNTISGSISSISVLINSINGPNNWSDLSFNSSGSGHAIGIASAGTFEFINFNYNGYATSNGSTGNEAIFNYSGGEVTINVTGGQTPPSVYNFGSSTTNIISTANVNILGLPNTVGLANSTEIRVYDRSQINPNIGFTTTEFVGVGTENHTSEVYSFTVGLGATFDLRILNLDYIPFFLSNQSADNNPTNIPVSLVKDRVYDDETPPSGE